MTLATLHDVVQPALAGRYAVARLVTPGWKDMRAFVGYAQGESSAGTAPAEAAKFAAETRVYTMATSIRNVHLRQDKEAGLDEARIRAIEALTTVPLVIYDGSGVPVARRSAVTHSSVICKFNICPPPSHAFRYYPS